MPFSLRVNALVVVTGTHNHQLPHIKTLSSMAYWVGVASIKWLVSSLKLVAAFVWSNIEKKIN
jgi:hypothetical protein